MAHHVLYGLPRRFYWESGTRIGALYTGRHERWDWGRVEIALEHGDSVQIEPAPYWLLNWAEGKLAEARAEVG